MLAMRLCHLVSLFLLEIGSVLTDPFNHQYPEECAPPEGAEKPALSTTISSINTTEVYSGVLPIEYCCPQVSQCHHLAGYCALNWMLDYVLPDCDFRTEDCRDYGCNCCINCNKDKCSKCTQHGGNCRTKCRPDETRDYFKKCSYQHCSCCKKCEMLDECALAYGTCVANHYDCPAGTAASTGCCGGCTCCKPELQKDFACERKTGSYCSLTEECQAGYYACYGECEATQFRDGLESPLIGYCCSPKNPPPSAVGRFEEIEDIESEQLNNLAPRPFEGERAQGDVEELVEDQIFEEVPLTKQEELPDFIEQSIVKEVVEEQTDEEVANLKKENKLNVEFASPVQEASNTDTAKIIDESMDISDQVDQVLASPISDQLLDSENVVDDRNGGAEKPRHHRRHMKQNDDIIEEVGEAKHHRRHEKQVDDSNDEVEKSKNHNRFQKD